MITNKSRAVFSGNEAIARGALEAGVRVAASYPGTPSTEILESLASVATERGIYAEWSTNEKVAFEVASAAAISGFRAIVSMKHPGVNWIADPLMVVNLSGVRAGLVIVACDDPGCHSSANEQDSRFYAQLSETLVLEPSDPQDAKDMTRIAFEVSEKIELPVFVRSVTRVSHSSSDVVLGKLPRKVEKDAVFVRDQNRFWISGKRGLNRHSWLHKQQTKIAEIANNLPFNRIENVDGKSDLCVATSGVAYCYVKEAMHMLGCENDISILKIGNPYPLPSTLVNRALQTFRKMLVIEEGEPFLELNLRVLSSTRKSDTLLKGKSSGFLKQYDELSTEIVLDALSDFTGERTKRETTAWTKKAEKAKAMLLERPMTFCPGCPHRPTLYALKQVVANTDGRAIVVGDIGCYALSVMPPYHIGDIKYSMGASIGVASGLSHIMKNPVIALIGDSTFFHAGIPGLINASYNNATIEVIVLDNQTTGMTGGQPHPGIGTTAMGQSTKKLRIEDIAVSCGADNVEVAECSNIPLLKNLMQRGIERRGVSVIISRGQCVLSRNKSNIRNLKAPKVDQGKCVGCFFCMTKFGCPAIEKKGSKVTINDTFCNGCGSCIFICPKNAICEA